MRSQSKTYEATVEARRGHSQNKTRSRSERRMQKTSAITIAEWLRMRLVIYKFCRAYNSDICCPTTQPTALAIRPIHMIESTFSMPLCLAVFSCIFVIEYVELPVSIVTDTYSCLHDVVLTQNICLLT